MNRKGLAILPIIIIVAVGLVIIGALFLLTREKGAPIPVSPPIANAPDYAPPSTEPPAVIPPTVNEPVVAPPGGISPNPVACTQEAKQCPDGSYVGRTGPNCEFAPCPSSSGGKSLDCAGPDDTSCPDGYQCIQDCGPPVARIGDASPPYHCVTNDVAVRPRMCPICLASNTEIDTPNGPLNVKDINAGTMVWSLNGNGQRIATKVIRVSRTPAPITHQVVHLALSDGREVWVSPNHPTADGRRAGELNSGDRYDGATVISADLVAYWDGFTYDLLPNSPTGSYWANGILLGSTLKKF